MNRKLTLTFASLTLAALPVLTGCRDQGAQVIEQDRSITTVDQIDIQDFRAAAGTLTKEMLDAPRVAQAISSFKAAHGNTNPLMKISKIKNDTMLKVDMRGFLVDPMETELTRTNLVDFYAEDNEARALAKMNETLNGTQPKLPDMVLYGTVRDLRSEAGRMQQASYEFQLKLADTTGRTIWLGNKLITKQGTRPSVGL